MKVHPAFRVKGRRYNDAMRLPAFGLTALLLALAGPDFVSLLRERGLERQSRTWVLAAESDLHRALRDIGTFEAHDVRCIVLPPEFTNAPALLGGSFINRFGYTIDTGASTLTLHRLDD